MIGNAIPYTDPTIAPLIINNMNNALAPVINNYVNGLPLDYYKLANTYQLPITNKLLPPLAVNLQAQGNVIHY